jgi:hypothetical protein
MLGCDGTKPTQPWTENLITGEPLTECPLRTIRHLRATEPELMAEYDRYLTTYYPLYLDGHLLVEGGIADQPARYLDYMLAIRQMDAAVNAKELDLAKENGEGEAEA